MSVFTLIKESAECTALLGESPVRFFEFGSAPEPETLPYATFQEIDGKPFNQLSGSSQADLITYQIDAWAKTANEVRAIAEAIRSAIDNDGYVVFFSSGRDDVSGLFRSTFRYQQISLR